MKRNAKNEIREQSVGELSKRIAELKKKIAAGKVNRYTKPSKNVREGIITRRTIAVLSTVLAQKRVAQSEEHV